MREQRVKKKLKKNKILLIVLIAIVILSILISFKLINKNSNPLVGKWTTEKGTIYQFNKDYTGKLILSIGEYEYKYEIKDNKVFVDFVSEKSTDTEFSYKFEEDKLILENKNGIFTFTKVE